MYLVLSEHAKVETISIVTYLHSYIDKIHCMHSNDVQMLPRCDRFLVLPL